MCCRPGRGLVGAAADGLARKRYRRMVIGCLSENPSCGFYEKLGGRLIREKTCTIGGRDYRESVFRRELPLP